VQHILKRACEAHSERSEGSQIVSVALKKPELFERLALMLRISLQRFVQHDSHLRIKIERIR
jgi:hypothetical protein